jgi:alpha-glucosidase (family GH31 glycosyl hydrolase)
MVELCARWMQLGAWYPFSRNHNAQNNPGHEPFRMGNVVLEASRHALNARMALTLYFYSLVHAAATDGGTVARPLSFEFPDDTATWDIDTQFMVGSVFMVSPVLERGVDRVEVYFPGGVDGGSGLVSTVWYDYWTGKRVVVSPSRRLSVPASLGSPMPVHIRGGQTVPRQVAGTTTGATVGGTMDLLVTLPTNDCGTHHGAATGSLYFDDGETALSDALNSEVALTAVWTESDEACYNGKPRGFTVRGSPTATDYTDVPDVSSITVFGVECPPGTVSLAVDGVNTK